MADEVSKLSGKLGIDTSDFKTAIVAANRELRVLESSFKAGASAMGDWTKDASGLELRAKSLTDKIDIQRLKVDALRAEHLRLAEANGENSRAAQEAEIKLNQETETLNKMENELTGTEAALEEMKTGEEEVGEAAEDMGEQVEDGSSKVETFKGVLAGMAGIAATVTTAVLAVGAAAIAAVGGIAALVFKAGDAAAELVDMSAKTGISTTRLQELGYAGDQLGTSLDTITGANARLVRSMFTASEQADDYEKKLADAIASGKDIEDIELGDAAKAFQTLGVSATDATGNLRDNQEVFADVIDALGKIENPTERDAIAMQLFGKSAQELNPLIKAGSDELERLAEEAHEVGAVMDEETVAGLEAFDDTVASIQAGVKGMLGTLAGQFLPVAKLVAKSLQDLFKSESFKKGVQEFTKLLEGFVKVTVDVLQKLLSGDISGALATMFGAEKGAELFAFFTMVRDFIFNTLIPFVTTHAEAIKAALIGIGAALAAAGIVAVIASIVAAINPVTLIIAAIVAAVALLSAAWAENWGGIRDIVAQVWEGFIKPIFDNFILSLQILAATWTNVLLPALLNVWGFLSESIFPLIQAIAEFIGAVFNLVLRVLAGLWQNILLPALQNVFGFLQANIFPVFQKIGDYISDKLQPIFDDLAGFLNNTLVPAFGGISEAIGGVIDWLITMADTLNNLTLPPWLTPGSPTPWELGLIGISEAMQELNKQLPTFANNLNLQTQPVGASSQSVSNDNSFANYGTVIMQGNAPAGSVGAQVKGRRY